MDDPPSLAQIRSQNLYLSSNSLMDLVDVSSIPTSLLMQITSSSIEIVIRNNHCIIEAPQPHTICRYNINNISHLLSKLNWSIHSVDPLVDKRFHILYIKGKKNKNKKIIFWS